MTPYVAPDNRLQSVTAQGITNISIHSMFAAPIASHAHFLESAQVTNVHATVDTVLKILDGETVKVAIPAGSAGKGATPSFPDGGIPFYSAINLQAGAAADIVAALDIAKRRI